MKLGGVEFSVSFAEFIAIVGFASDVSLVFSIVTAIVARIAGFTVEAINVGAGPRLASFKFGNERLNLRPLLIAGSTQFKTAEEDGTPCKLPGDLPVLSAAPVLLAGPIVVLFIGATVFTAFTGRLGNLFGIVGLFMGTYALLRLPPQTGWLLVFYLCVPPHKRHPDSAMMSGVLVTWTILGVIALQVAFWWLILMQTEFLFSCFGR